MTGALPMLRVLAALDRPHRTPESVAAAACLDPLDLSLALAEGRRLGLLTPPRRPAPRIEAGRVVGPEAGDAGDDLPTITPAGRAWAAAILAPLGDLLAWRGAA